MDIYLRLILLQKKIIVKLFKYINTLINNITYNSLYCFKIREPILEPHQPFGSLYNLNHKNFHMEYNRNWYKLKRYELMKFKKMEF